MSEPYNGWKNYETWSVALCIDNDEPSHDHWRGLAMELFGEAEADATFTRVERAALALAGALKESHEAQAEDAGLQGVLSDLLNAALSEVDWMEIALDIYSVFDKTQLDGLAHGGAHDDEEG